jgi:hypothetical protein
MNKSLQSILKFWNVLPLFQMLFLWLNKTPPKWNPPLSVKEGFDESILKYYFLPYFWSFTEKEKEKVETVMGRFQPRRPSPERKTRACARALAAL